MNPRTLKQTLQGQAGLLEMLVDEPELSEGEKCKGVAVIAHPHPLYGGTMDNKVVQTMARAFVLAKWRAVRFNFRGVGQSQGVYDEGRGELQDLLDVVAQMAPQASHEGGLALAGFSFGSFVTSHAAQALFPMRPIYKLVLVGTAASRFEVAQIDATLHDRTLVLHGEEDDTVPLANVMAWARPQTLPVTVIPGGGHFFHGQLPLLRSLVLRHLLLP
jgi:alpha/beta superfamily hydrolase